MLQAGFLGGWLAGWLADWLTEGAAVTSPAFTRLHRPSPAFTADKSISQCPYKNSARILVACRPGGYRAGCLEELEIGRLKPNI